jgi:hypothetical protein
MFRYLLAGRPLDVIPVKARIQSGEAARRAAPVLPGNLGHATFNSLVALRA